VAGAQGPGKLALAGVELHWKLVAACFGWACLMKEEVSVVKTGVGELVEAVVVSVVVTAAQVVVVSLVVEVEGLAPPELPHQSMSAVGYWEELGLSASEKEVPQQVLILSFRGERWMGWDCGSAGFVL